MNNSCLLKDIARKIVRRIINRPSNIIYQCGRFNLVLPKDHRLPSFQKYSPLYDRFLPVLAHFLRSNSVVIDIGANCGDTIAAMASSNSSLNYFAIEADRGFYEYLRCNVERISEENPEVKIRILNTFVGKELDSVILDGRGGTKKAITLDHGTSAEKQLPLKSRSLDTIISESRISAADIALIKVDTDGNDYDVLNSASTIIGISEPLLFFECQYDTNEQMQRYKRVIEHYFDIGYTYWTLFDNYGAVIIPNASLYQILSLVDYIYCQNMGRSSRTIWYMDVLCSTEKHVDIVRRALIKYDGLMAA